MEPGCGPLHHAEWLPALCGSLRSRLWLGPGRGLHSVPGEHRVCWEVRWLGEAKQDLCLIWNGVYRALPSQSKSSHQVRWRSSGPQSREEFRGGLLENIIPELSESQRRSLAPSRRGREARNASRRNSTSKDRRFETVVYVEGGRGRIRILVAGDEPRHLDGGPWMKGRGIGYCSLVDIPHSSPTWPSK